jgi:hypothetical protein
MRDDGEEIAKMKRTVKRIDEQIRSLLEAARKRAAGYSDANLCMGSVLKISKPKLVPKMQWCKLDHYRWFSEHNHRFIRSCKT